MHEPVGGQASDDPFVVLVGQTMATYRMVEPGQRVLVAVSGGPDSLSLLQVMVLLRSEWELSLIVGHLDHGFRGKESADEAEYVREVCERLGVECWCDTVDVPALQRERRLSAQEAAREARHAFLNRVATEHGAQRIALGHTRDDRTETVLLNILRGTGLEGLAGFPPTAFPLIRPLYRSTRKEVEAYCQRCGLAPRYDSSNLKRLYRRNRIRLDLLPSLRSDYNAQIDVALLRLADLANDDNILLDSMANEALAGIISTGAEIPAPDSLRLSRTELERLPVALQRRVLRVAITKVRGSLKDVGFSTIEHILSPESLRNEEGSIHQLDTHQLDTHQLNTHQLDAPRLNTHQLDAPRLNTEHGAEHGVGRSYGIDLPAYEGHTVRIRSNARAIDIARSVATETESHWQLPVQCPGITMLKRSAEEVCTISATPIGNGTELLDLLRHWPDTFGQTGISIWRRADILLPLVLRSRRTGDRFRPRGLGGTKKLQDLLVDARIPRDERDLVPLLVEAGGEGRILSVGGWRYSEEVLFTGSLRRVQTCIGMATAEVSAPPVESDIEDATTLEDFNRMKFILTAHEELLVLFWGYE